MSHVDEKMHVRIVNVHFEHFAADQNLSADNSADFRRLDREVLVRSLRLHFEGLDSLGLNQIQHIFDRFFSDGVQIARSFYRRADGRYAKDLADLFEELLSVYGLVRPDVDQSLMAAHIHTGKLFYVLFDSLYQHALKIWFVHPLERHFTAPDDENILFVHCSTPTSPTLWGYISFIF